MAGRQILFSARPVDWCLCAHRMQQGLSSETLVVVLLSKIITETLKIGKFLCKAHYTSFVPLLYCNP